jgi:hypothetical protein
MLFCGTTLPSSENAARNEYRYLSEKKASNRSSTVKEKLKEIIWFSNITFESEAGVNIDWTLTSNQEVKDHYRQVAADPYFIKAP